MDSSPKDEPLLRAVYARPDDDAARLVLADRLLEQRDPWGELIALQCRRASDGVASAPFREKKLIEAHGARFLGPLAAIVEPRGARFERGFVAGCSLQAGPVPESLRLSPAWSTVREVWGYVPPPLRAHLAQLGVRFSDESSPVRASWTWLHAWLARCAPERRPQRAGATAAAIAAAERAIGRPLPDEQRELLGVVDGTPDEGGAIGRWSLFSSVEIAREWQFMRSLEAQVGNEHPEHVEGEGVRDQAWNHAYVPLARGDSRTRLLVDLDPGRDGTVGQIITFAYETHTRRVVAPSVRAWLVEHALRWQEGSWVAVEDGDGELDATMELAAFARIPADEIAERDLAIRPRRDPRRSEEVVPAAHLDAVDEGARFLAHLVEQGLVGLVAGADDAPLARGLGERLRARIATPEKAAGIVTWLERHPAVDDVYLDEDQLAALLDLW